MVAFCGRYISCRFACMLLPTVALAGLRNIPFVSYSQPPFPSPLEWACRAQRSSRKTHFPTEDLLLDPSIKAEVERQKKIMREAPPGSAEQIRASASYSTLISGSKRMGSKSVVFSHAETLTGDGGVARVPLKGVSADHGGGASPLTPHPPPGDGVGSRRTGGGLSTAELAAQAMAEGPSSLEADMAREAAEGGLSAVRLFFCGVALLRPHQRFSFPSNIYPSPPPPFPFLPLQRNMWKVRERQASTVSGFLGVNDKDAMATVDTKQKRHKEDIMAIALCDTLVRAPVVVVMEKGGGRGGRG